MSTAWLVFLLLLSSYRFIHIFFFFSGTLTPDYNTPPHPGIMQSFFRGKCEHQNFFSFIAYHCAFWNISLYVYISVIFFLFICDILFLRFCCPVPKHKIGFFWSRMGCLLFQVQLLTLFFCLRNATLNFESACATMLFNFLLKYLGLASNI